MNNKLTLSLTGGISSFPLFREGAVMIFLDGPFIDAAESILTFNTTNFVDHLNTF